MPTEFQSHNHDGSNSQLINLADIAGFIETVSVAPTHTPRNFFDQFKIYSNSTTYRFYWYDTTNQAWRYVQA